jgi:potassium efflux system protein
MQEPRDIVKAIPFFAEVLTDAEIDALTDHAMQVHFDKGATLMHEDDAARSMFVIISGAVEVTSGSRGQHVATLKAGDVVGEMSLLIGTRRTANVVAVEPVEALEIGTHALGHALSASPDLAERFADMLDRRQAELDDIFGGGAWGMIRIGRGEILSLIRRFYEKQD